MYKQGLGDFKYHVGIGSLAHVATREDRVCVLNILGGESSDVTPVSHAYSGGNVVVGTAPVKGGQVTAARWAATTQATFCGPDPSRSSPTRAASPPPSRSTCA